MTEPVKVIFGVAATMFIYWLGGKIYYKTGKPSILHPNIFSMVTIVIILLGFNIPYENSYEPAGNFIRFFLRPSVVVLALPLYRSLKCLLNSKFAILTGVFAGVLTSSVSIAVLAVLFRLDFALLLSLLPKSITTPMAIEVSESMGGIIPLTVFSVIITGVLGAIVARRLYPLFGINEPVAKGVAIGTASHFLGTSKALELGTTEGAMSGLALAVCGLITVFYLPVFRYILILLMGL